jgi:hypothetical protein
VGPVPKKGKNEDYNYQRASDVALAFRHELFKRGVRVTPNELEFSEEKIPTNGGGVITRARLKIEFVVSDGKENEKYHAFGIAQDAKDKALWKAKTGALKYFLRGLGLIPDAEDDPEFEETTTTAPAAGQTKKAKPAKRKPQSTVLEFEIRGFMDACQKSGRSVAEMETYLTHHRLSSITELQRKDFKVALRWARRQDVQNVQQASGGRAEVEAVVPLGDAQPTAMTPPVALTTEQAQGKIVGALLDGGYLAPVPERRPQLVVRELDREPEFKLRGY